MVGIYKITSPTKKVYIGQTWNTLKRRSSYRKLSCKSQPKLYNSIIKHGWENHSFELIHELPKDATQKTLDNYEVFYWEQYKECGVNLLNTKEPGKGGKHSEESKRKMSKAHIGIPKSKEHIEKSTKTRIANGNHKRSATTVQKIVDKNNKPIRHIQSNRVFESRKEAAIAFNYTAPNINYYVKKGVFEYIKK
jgi:group I intron endonuclease